MAKKKAVLFITDGLGGRPSDMDGETCLEAADTPNLDELSSQGINGMLHPLGRGERPGSDTAHLALFGYDPEEVYTGRGVFEASGIGMEIQKNDICFRTNFATLLTGTAGTGKTIFCSQFLWQGLQEGDNCLFITFEERPEKIKDAAADFGWDFEKYEDEGQLVIEHKNPFQASKGDELFWFRDEIEKHDIDRVVLDSTSVLSLYYEDKYDVRKNLFKLVAMLEKEGVTAVLTTESEEGQDKLTRFGVEEFLADGVIKLDILSMGSSSRSLSVKKMRRTDIDTKSHGMEITEEGLKISE